MTGWASSRPQKPTLMPEPRHGRRRGRARPRRSRGRRRTRAGSRRRAGARRTRSRRRSRTPCGASSASWAGTPCVAHIARTASSIPAGPHAYTTAWPSRSSSGVEQVGDGSVVADRAVVARHPRPAAAARRPRRAGRRESRAGRSSRPRARPGGSQAARSPRHRRRGSPGAPAWRREADSERPERPQPVARPQLAQPPRARTHVLEQEVGLPVAPAGDREGARQVWPLVLAPAPALGGREHRELARLGVAARRDRRPSARGRPRPSCVHAGDSQQPAAERGVAELRSLTPPRLRAAPAGTAPGGCAVSPRARDRARGRDPGRERGQAGDSVRDRGAADLPAVGSRARPRWGC